MMKKTISILLTLCMIVALMPAAMAAKKATFTDVPEDMWCFDYVEYVADEGYFKGTTETTFEPNGPMTRQQFVVVLSRMVNVKVNNDQSPFSDVPAGSYSAGAIAWASKNGITQGYEDGTFRPTEPITRQQMCAFMNRFMTYYANNYGVRYTSKNAKITFEDEKDIAAYASSAVDYCVKYGLIYGYEDGTFRPTANATRAHVAAIIQRLDKITRKSSGGGGGSYVPITYYTITFDGATVNGQSSATVQANTPYACLTPDAKAGYTFLNWSDGTNTYNVGDTFVVTGDVTLTANWDEDIVPDDVLKTAFKDTVDYVNDNLYSRYENAQGIVEIDSIVVDPVSYNFDGDTREIYVNASAELMDDTLQSLVKRAVDYAVALVKSTEPAADELTADYETVKATVQDVVEALGLTWTGKDIEALAREIYDQGVDAAYDIWDLFQADGDYIFETADVIVAGETVFSITAETKSTSLGAKASAKALAVAVAKELYADLKTETAPDNTVELTTSVTMSFNGVPEKAEGYPTEYTMIATMTFTSDVVSYYYADNTHHFVLTISQEWQDTYDAALAAIAEEALAVAEATLAEKMDGMLDGYLSGSAMNSMIEQLVKFGIYADADAANAAIAAVAESAADAWIAENLGTAETPDGVTYYLPYDFFWLQNGQIEISGNEYILTIDGADTGRKLFNNAVLVETIEAWADDMIANADIQSIMDDAMSDMLDPDTKAQYQELVISEATTQLSSGTAAYLVNYLTNGTVNGTGRNLFKDMFLYDDVAALAAAPAASAIAGFDNALSYDCVQGSAEHLVKSVMVEVVADKVDDVFADVMASMNDPLITDLINSSAEVQVYVKDLAMVEMGFETSYAPSTEETDAALADIETYLNDYIEDKINTTLNPADLTAMIDEQIVSLVSGYSQYLQYLPYLQSLNTFDELAAGQLSTVAAALGSNELQALIAKADISDENMAKALNALAKAIEKLPADASVTINGKLTVSEAALAGIKAAAEAHDLALVCDLAADMLNELGDLSLDSIDGIPVVLTYGQRSVTCALHVVIE